MEIEQYVIVSHDALELSAAKFIIDNPTANVIVTHGLGEHSGRYSYLTDQLNLSNYNVFLYDLRGHGKSKGDSAHTDDYLHYLKDLETVIDHVGSDYPDLPVFLLGHSMGGFIASLFGIKTNDQVSGIILSGALTQTPKQAKGVMRYVLKFIGKIVPKTSVKNDLGKLVSKDPEVVKAYLTDELNRTKISLGLYHQLLVNGIDFVKNNLEQFNYPLLCLHGGNDLIVDPIASKILFEKVSSSDKKLKIYDGLYHEILNEPERDTVIEDIRHWISERV